MHPMTATTQILTPWPTSSSWNLRKPTAKSPKVWLQPRYGHFLKRFGEKLEIRWKRRIRALSASRSTLPVTESKSYANAITPTIPSALTSGSRTRKGAQFVMTALFEAIATLSKWIVSKTRQLNQKLMLNSIILIKKNRKNDSFW